MTLRTLDYGTYGIFLILGHAGFFPSTVRIEISGIRSIISSSIAIAVMVILSLLLLVL